MTYQIMLEPELAQSYKARGLWTGETFFEVLARKAGAHPNREVFADAKGRITYGALKDRVERCAEFLRRIGIGKGDVVTIQLPNRIDFPVVFFALELIGAVANKVNPDFRARELEYILKFSNSRAYVCPREFKSFDYVAMARELKKAVPGLRDIVVAGGAGEGAHDLDAGLADCPPVAPQHRVEIDPDAIFRMAFTSGTTGDPKCVLHSPNSTLYAGYLLNEDMKVTESDVQLIYLPIGLNWGYFCLLQTVMAGCRAVLLERFSARAALELIEKERVSYIATAPASIVAMLNEPELSKYDVSSLRVVITGGASAAIETIRDYQARMKGHLIELYGMLETGFHTYTRFSDDPQKVNGTIGRVAGALELRIVDDSGNDVPRGEIGEIAARGPSVHLGYHNNPSANAGAFIEGGWFRTGDLGRYVDDAGNVQITGRSKEIINRGGKKFFPREVEEILYTHPKILHAAMVGIPDKRLGERNCLCVVPKPGQALTLEEAVGFLKGQVADYKLPEMVERFDELPMTGTGKIRRHILRDLVTARMGAG
ncbi:MAG: AMP-binding protein [Alphaproteobacteria bacterium]|nr:AMP-binding protein [Alphaproteobacteria bacterium]